MVSICFPGIIFHSNCKSYSGYKEFCEILYWMDFRKTSIGVVEDGP